MSPDPSFSAACRFQARRWSQAHRPALAACVALLLLALPATGQPISPEPLAPGWEQWFDKVPVGGGVRVGVMAALTADPVDPASFVVYVPKAAPPQLCVEVSSKDGRYEALLAYEIPEGRAGPTAFELPTAHEDELSSYAGYDLSILAHLGRCNESAVTYLVSAWGNPSAPDTVSVFVNSRVPTFLVGGAGGQTDFSYPCEPISAGVPTKAYNRECRLPASAIVPGATFEVQRRVRKPGGRVEIKPYPLPLQL